MLIPELIDVPAEIHSDRLLIRGCLPGDGEAVFQAVEASRTELKHWMPWTDSADSAESCEQSVIRAYARFATREDLRLQIFLKDGTFIGGTGLHGINWTIPRFEIGYWIHSHHTGKGYATEAAARVTEVAFEVLNARRVVIRCDVLNLASAAIPKKLGYDLEGVMRQDALAEDGSGRLRDTMVFSKIRM